MASLKTEPKIESKAPESLREIIRDVLGEPEPRQQFRDHLERIRTLESFQRLRCPSCSEDVRVPSPDIKRQHDLYMSLLDQAFGKPGTDSVEQQGTTIIVELAPDSAELIALGWTPPNGRATPSAVV